MGCRRSEIVLKRCVGARAECPSEIMPFVLVPDSEQNQDFLVETVRDRVQLTTISNSRELPGMCEPTARFWLALVRSQVPLSK